MAIKTPKPGTQTRDIPALSMRAALGGADVVARTVSVTWTTGAKVLRESMWEGPFYEELSLDPKHVRMGRLNGGAPFLANHDARSVGSTLGVVQSARLEGNKGTAVIRFAKAEDDPEADKIFRKIADGIIQNVSVGYRIHTFEKVEGGDATIPTFRAVDWEPHEISAVAIGADAGAGFRSADVTPNPCNFISRSTEKQTMDPEEQKRLEAEKVALAARELELSNTAEKAVRAERERVSGITAAFRSFGEAAPKHAEKLAAMLAGATTLEAARSYVLEELAKASDAIRTEPASGIERGADDRDQFRKGVSDALLSRSGDKHVKLAIARKVEGFEKVGDGAQYRGMTLADLARVCLKRAGVKVEGIYDRERIVGMALERSGYATGGDFPVLMEDIARKAMRAGYAVQPDSWRRWMGTDSVADFKDASRFLAGSFGALPVVAPDAEYQNVAIPDGAKNVINTETRGGIIAIGRHAIVNDDLGFLTNIASQFGASAGKSIEFAAYALLAQNSGLGPTMADTEPFFHSNRANVATGGALSAASLDVDKLKMRAQKDVSDNDFLDLVPRILLIPVGLESAAKILNTDAYDPAQVGQKSNSAQGMFGDIVSSPRLTASTTRRYVFSENKEAFKCVFLDGSGEGPTLSSEEGFRRDGMEFKARIDFKCQAYDPKAAVTNAGT